MRQLSSVLLQNERRCGADAGLQQYYFKKTHVGGCQNYGPFLGTLKILGAVL